MFVIYLRSSSIGDFLSCQHKYYLGYTLGIQLDSNQAAKKGVVVHKAMELLARKKIAVQNKEKFFTEDDTKKTFEVKSFNTYASINFAIDYYKKEFNLTDWDIKQVKDSYWNTIKYNNGEYNPLNRKVLDVEHFFNFEIDEEWSYYTYLIKDEPYIGKLCLRGTMDLVTEIDKDTLHYIDWKTGSRVDWKVFKNGKPIEKTIEIIKKDPQLQLYHYVIRKKFPTYKDVMMTLYFTKDGGPYTVKFTMDDYYKHENFIKNLYENIKKVESPSLIKDEPNKNPHCKFCQFNKFKMDNGQTYCSYYENEIRKIGLDKVTERDIVVGKHFSYEGGGASRVLD